MPTDQMETTTWTLMVMNLMQKDKHVSKEEKHGLPFYFTIYLDWHYVYEILSNDFLKGLLYLQNYSVHYSNQIQVALHIIFNVFITFKHNYFDLVFHVLTSKTIDYYKT